MTMQDNDYPSNSTEHLLNVLLSLLLYLTVYQANVSVIKMEVTGYTT